MSIHKFLLLAGLFVFSACQPYPETEFRPKGNAVLVNGVIDDTTLGGLKAVFDPGYGAEDRQWVDHVAVVEGQTEAFEGVIFEALAGVLEPLVDGFVRGLRIQG